MRPATHVIFESDDADVIEDMFRGEFGRVELTDAHVSIATDVVVDDRFFFGRYSFVGRLEALNAIDGFSVTSTGDYRWAVGDERGDGRSQPFLARPGVPNTTSLADTSMEQVYFEVGALQHTARTVYGDDRLSLAFDSPAPVSAAAGRLVTDSLAYALACGPLVLESDLVRASLYRYLAVVVLESFALRGDREARHRTTAALREGHRRAVTFIDDFASLPITLDDIAEAAGLDEQGLQAAFRSHSVRGTSVRDHLRAARLDAAHRDLVAADPTAGDTVRAIALRWGFSPSRLAALHRATYGVSPKWVLDR